MIYVRLYYVNLAPIFGRSGSRDLEAIPAELYKLMARLTAARQQTSLLSLLKKTCTPFSAARNEELKVAYGSKRTSYNEPLAATDPVFTVELLDRLLDQMKNG